MLKPRTNVMAVTLASGLLWHCSSETERGARGAAPGVENDGARGGVPDDAARSPSAGAEDTAGDGAAGSEVTLAGMSVSEGNPNPSEVVGTDPNLPPGDGQTTPEQPAVPGTPRFQGAYILGADISSIQEAVDGGAVYVDTDGQEKDILELLAGHGFNYVRLRTFVEPLAEFGYASGSSCQQKAEAYNDRDHTVAYAREVKAAGMGLLLDFHYSDTWADPGKQVIPEAWRGVTSIDAMADQVRAYTVDVLGAMVAAGARPDMVQVGNEITPGMLIHVPTANTDCYGNGSTTNPVVNGSQGDWDNLATLLRAGIEGVKQVDDAIQIMLHVENTANPGGVIDWVQNALERGVAFDVLGLSAYEAFQGPASAWDATLNRLADRFPELSFAIAEYNPQRRLLNDIMRGLPDGRGLGTFFWEPTQSGSWGASMFTWQGNRLTANADDFAEYDQLRADFGL